MLPRMTSAPSLPQAEPPRLADPVRRLLEMLGSADRSPPQRTLIALAGLPGSGKSTLAAAWTQAVNAQAGPGAMVALGMDGFHLSRAALARFPDPVAALRRRGAPWTFDPQALARQLQALRQPGAAESAPVDWPGFEHGVGDPVEAALSVAPGTRLVLVEGLYLLHKDHGWDVASAFDERWFLDVPLTTACERLARRHMATSDQSLAQAQERIAVNDRLNAGIVLTTRSGADWLVAVD
jgi:pantothenate kinase